MATGPTLALIGVVAAVGIGSFTFHTVATRGAVLADVVPIAVFIYGYLLLALRRFLRLPCLAAGAIVVAYAAAAQGISALAPPRFLNGSVGYLPALAALIAVAAVAREKAVQRGLAVAALLFAISLALRTADIALCPAFPLGTHFAWHILNAVVLYVLLHTAMAARPAAVGWVSRRRNPPRRFPHRAGGMRCAYSALRAAATFTVRHKATPSRRTTAARCGRRA